MIVLPSLTLTPHLQHSKAIRQYDLLDIGVAGVPTDLTYPYTHLGSDTECLKQLASGKHAWSKVQRAMSVFTVPNTHRRFWHLRNGR